MNALHYGIVTALTVAFAAAGFNAPESQPKPQHDHGMQACAEACSDCQRACDMCTTHCIRLLKDGKEAHIKSAMTCQDCADICAVAASIVSRSGPFSVTICEACADACAACAKQCEAFPDDEHMKECAEECRKCEKACREMIAHAAHRA
jgi:hypothetical protein